MKFFPPAWAICYCLFLGTEASFKKYPHRHTSLHLGKTSTQKEDKSLICCHNSRDASTTADRIRPASCWKVGDTCSGGRPRTEANLQHDPEHRKPPHGLLVSPTPVNGIAAHPPNSPHHKAAGHPVSFLASQAMGPNCH